MEKKGIYVSGADPSLESGVVAPVIDRAAEKSYGNRLSFKRRTRLTSLAVRKLDFYLLPFLSLMYFFNSVDRYVRSQCIINFIS